MSKARKSTATGEVYPCPRVISQPPVRLPRKPCGGSTLWRVALEQAELAARLGKVPVGAVVGYEDRIVGRGANTVIRSLDSTARALRVVAKALGNYRLAQCSLYSTLEHCPLCAGALGHAPDRLPHLLHPPRRSRIKQLITQKLGFSGSSILVRPQEYSVCYNYRLSE